MSENSFFKVSNFFTEDIYQIILQDLNLIK